jgi:cell shape-determining protein MreC
MGSLADSTGSAFQILPALGIFLTLILTIAASVGVWAAMRVGKNTQTISNYKNAAESASALAQSLQAELAELRQQQQQDNERTRQKETDYQAEIAALTAKVQVLEDLATGQTAMKTLMEVSNTNTAYLREILGILRDGKHEAINARA